MTSSRRVLAVTAAALMLGIGLTPALAIELNVLGVGVSANVGGDSIASAGVSSGPSGGQTVNLAVNDTSGDLVDLNQDGNQTSGNVNLGLDGLGLGDLGLGDLGLDDLLGGGLDGLLPGDGTGGGAGGGGGGGGLTPTQIASAFGGASGADQNLLRRQCRSVLANPASFEPNVVELCRVIARLQMQGLN